MFFGKIETFVKAVEDQLRDATNLSYDRSLEVVTQWMRSAVVVVVSDVADTTSHLIGVCPARVIGIQGIYEQVLFVGTQRG